MVVLIGHFARAATDAAAGTGGTRIPRLVFMRLGHLVGLLATGARSHDISPRK
jgi:hypothetical protein